mgnify:CR=1 FL=1
MDTGVQPRAASFCSASALAGSKGAGELTSITNRTAPSVTERARTNPASTKSMPEGAWIVLRHASTSSRVTDI